MSIGATQLSITSTGKGAGDAIHPVLGKGVVWFTRLTVHMHI